MTHQILLVSPGFHGYWSAIAAAFESLGAEVTTHRYDEHSTLAERAQNKFLHDLPEQLRWGAAEERATRRAVDRLRAGSFDAVVVIKGDQLGAAWWEALAKSGIPSVVWLYDEIRRTRYSLDFLARIGPIASYSKQDVVALQAAGATAGHVALGYDSLLDFASVTSSAVTLVGARYPNREALLVGIRSAGVPVRAYGREWSRRLWDVARTRRLRGAGIPSGTDLNRASAYGVMAGSLATLNIHSNQDGFTMRTFEAAGVGALELVDRADVSEFYEIGKELLVFDTVEDIVESAHKAQKDPSWARAIRAAGRKRTLAEHTLTHRARSLEAMWA
ncbi:CgeB family protein [Pseudoclavibacter helvolus]|uniref:CgeB family protein n=1 Tax=Pseudoclavibacter helvolus TaxID=255205 RepID=UPI003C763FF4